MPDTLSHYFLAVIYIMLRVVTDRYGNRWQQKLLTGSGPAPNFGFNANNQVASGEGVTYDAAGNTIDDGVHQYFYDSEDRIEQVDGTLGSCSTATACYTYDAHGHRVEKTTGSVSTDYIYDLAGYEVAQYTAAGGWTRGEVYAGGRHLATYNGGASGTMYFIHADWLTNERIRTNVTGAAAEWCTNLPYGDGLNCLGTDVSPMHFTGKEHDNETGLENFSARYDASSFGRFMSPDPVGGKRLDPQTLNRYSYAHNSPMTLTDPTGLYTCLDDNNQCNTKNDRNLHDALVELRVSGGAQGALEAYNFGTARDDNGVHVDFKSQEGMGGKGIFGSTSPGGKVERNLVTGQAVRVFDVHVDVNFLTGMKGKTLEQTVAHEGSHLDDIFKFIQSFDFSSGKFNWLMNYTHYNTEVKAFEMGATMKSYPNLCGTPSCEIVNGSPHEYRNIDRYLTDPRSPYDRHNFDLEFDPKDWPQ
jgi:RHS repeat-associated protein